MALGPKQTQFTQQMKELEARLEELRIEFEKYFVGVESRVPAQQRNILERDMRRFLESNKIMKPADRLKKDNLRSKFVSYQNLWNRTLRQIEDGTYRRHIMLKKQREKLAKELGYDDNKPKSSAAGQSDDGSFDLSAGVDSGTRKYDGVYSDYKAAGMNVSYQKLETLLKKQEAAIKAKYGADKVQFSVKVVDGKPKLSAKPIK